MDEAERNRNLIFWRLRWQLRLTRAGLVAERAVRAFWPLWTLALGAVAAVAFGLLDRMRDDAALALAAAVAVGLAWFLLRGLRQFRWPGHDEAVARLDATLSGRPLTALADRQAVGAGDPASAAVWQAHVARMATHAAGARAPAPDLRIARRDPLALRYAALTAFVLALVFGAFGRVANVAAIAPGAEAGAAGPVWEGWIAPPSYTGKPSLYLNDIAAGAIEIPRDSRVTLRFYGEPGALGLDETVSGQPVAPAADAPPLTGAEFAVAQSGTLRISGPNGRDWAVTVLPDAMPQIAPAGSMTRESDGQLRQDFTASDDYGVVAGHAEISLDLGAVDRRFGLAAEPEARPALVFDLPMPFRGDRTEIAETLVDDASKHPFANLPVRLRLHAEDALAQTGLSDEVATVLPGRRFFDPLAAAIIEARRDLLWSAANAPRVAQVMRAVTHAPEGFVRNERAFLRLRVALRRLEAGMAPTLAPGLRDELAEALWEIALMVEEGDLASALERLRRAQDRLDEAMRNGADESEIQELMDELREALDNYMRQLAEQAEQNPGDEMSENMQGMQMTGNQLQELLDRLQQLMEEGRMAEAQELMEMLRQLMENMQVTQGPGGQGEGQGQRQMRDLAETLRDQQGLSDDSFRELQDQFNPGGQQGQQGQQGEGNRGRDGRQRGEGNGEADGRSLAERQRDLRDRLRGLSGQELPGEGSERGEAGRRALDRAGRAMDQAERALRDRDLSGALDRQAEALESLREGMRELGEAMAEDMRREDGSDQGQQFGNADPRSQRDPLGRTPGQMGRLGTDEEMLKGDDLYRRAQDLLEELRRRAGDRARTAEERDYINRLLDRF